MVASWNSSKLGNSVHYPVNTPNEADCATGPLLTFGGRKWALLRSKRANSLNENGYAMCPQQSLRKTGCVVYSCGIDEDPSFELHVSQSTSCEVFAFDPSPSARRWMGYLTATADPPLPMNLHYLPWGWSNRDMVMADVDPWQRVEINGSCHNCFWPWDSHHWGTPSRRWEMRRVSSIARLFNHHHVDIVKMDCEGVEYAPGFLKDLLSLQPTQIILEQHANRQVFRPSNFTEHQVSAADWISVQDTLHAAGYRQVWKGRLALNLGEYTFARRELTDLVPVGDSWL